MTDSSSAAATNMPPKIPTSMRAVALSKFSKPSDYNIASLPVPEISNPEDVLIKVHAASVNPVDVKMASPQIGPLFDSKPVFPYKIGYDVSGTVVSVGSSSQFKVGDLVYARVPNTHRGTLAEYASTPSSYVAHKPQSITHAEAASIPLAAQTAFQAFLKADGLIAGGLKGKTVFIPGGLSGTGSFGVQLAKNYFGAGKVITTLSPKKIAVVNEVLGEGVVDQVVDYTKGNPAVISQIGVGTVDFFFDPLGQSIAFASLVKKGGLILSISTVPNGSDFKRETPNMAWYLEYFLNFANWGFTKYIEIWAGVQYSYFLLKPNGKDLEALGRAVDEGKVKPIVGEKVALEDIEGVRRGCLQVLEGKGGLGKFVVEVVKE